MNFTLIVSLKYVVLRLVGAVFLFFFCVIQCNAQVGNRIPIFLQEALDAKGKKLGDRDGTEQLMAYFERETHLKFELVYLPWRRAQFSTLQGKGIIWGFSKTKERMESYRYSETVAVSPIWAVAYGEPKIPLRTLSDLQGKTVSVERGVSHGMEFELARNTVFKVDEDPASAALRFKKLILKRSDVLLWGLIQFDQSEEFSKFLNTIFIPRLQDPDLLNQTFYVSSHPLFYDTIHFAAVKGQFSQEMEKIDVAIKTGLKTGELRKLLADLRKRSIEE